MCKTKGPQSTRTNFITMIEKFVNIAKVQLTKSTAFPYSSKKLMIIPNR